MQNSLGRIEAIKKDFSIFLLAFFKSASKYQTLSVNLFAQTFCTSSEAFSLDSSNVVRINLNRIT
jgi:hypothetical protein